MEARVPAGHPLRAMRRLTNAALEKLDGDFSTLYEAGGRPSIPPERLLRATLLQFLYSIRSARQLVERLEFDLLFRWFVGLGIDEPAFDASSFSKNRDRLLTHEIAQSFLASLLALPEVKPLLSAEHFSVDGTLLKAWASMKSFRAKDGSDEPPSAGRMARRISARPSVRMKRTPRRPIRTRGCTRRATAKRAVWPISAMP
jgi:transposase